jgi:hypothetical protein
MGASVPNCTVRNPMRSAREEESAQLQRQRRPPEKKKQAAATKANAESLLEGGAANGGRSGGRWRERNFLQLAAGVIHFFSRDSAAASLRSMCGSERGPPECRTQRSPTPTPQVGQVTEDNCLGVSECIFIQTGCGKRWRQNSSNWHTFPIFFAGAPALCRTAPAAVAVPPDGISATLRTEN